MSAPTFQTVDLSSNRSDGLPRDTLQVVCFYDGNSTAAMEIEYLDTSGTVGRLGIDSIKPFGTEIKTMQYLLNGCTLTGNFWIKGVQANGVVDGVAFGLFWRDTAGNYHILRSNGKTAAPRACFVAAWPLGGHSAAVFATRAPQLTNGFAQETALAVISGAKLLPDGAYSLSVF